MPQWKLWGFYVASKPSPFLYSIERTRFADNGIELSVFLAPGAGVGFLTDDLSLVLRGVGWDGSIPSAQLKSQGLTYVIWSAEWNEANDPYSFWSFPLWWWFYVFEQSWHSHFQPTWFLKGRTSQAETTKNAHSQSLGHGKSLWSQVGSRFSPKSTCSEPRCSSFLPLEMVLDSEVLL